MLVLQSMIAAVACTASEGGEYQEYAMVTTRKACRGEDATSSYCQALAKATNSSVMGTTFAAALYDEYHKRGAGGLKNRTKPRPEQQILVEQTVGQTATDT